MFIEPAINGQRRGWIEVICGSMFSGKTEELIRRLKRVKIANLKVEIFKPAIDATILAESLNDKLKQGKTELVEVLKETPVKDLRKAIGINDRFLFINELFRGDEAMYERSIKTINSFNIYPEAEYWISRELKIKVGWSNDNPTVKHFDHLVKRRFS